MIRKGVYTRFFPRVEEVEDRKRTATSPPEVDTPRLQKVPKGTGLLRSRAAPSGAQSKGPKKCTSDRAVDLPPCHGAF